jgi:hypothetical protein
MKNTITRRDWMLRPAAGLAFGRPFAAPFSVR